MSLRIILSCDNFIQRFSESVNPRQMFFAIMTEFWWTNCSEEYEALTISFSNFLKKCSMFEN